MQRVRKQIGVPEEVLSSDGRKITIAVLDTGIGNHQDLFGKVLCFQDFVGNKKHMYDDSGHGTHVCGIICGTGAHSKGLYRGIAPDSNLVVGKVLDKNGDGKTEDMLRALEWILKIRKEYGIRVLNISVGIGTLDSSVKELALKNKIEEVWDNGIIVVCAAGNKGPMPGSISSVGGSTKSITVGCHDGEFCKDNPKRCERYSGRGELFAMVKKPDIVAPGTDIMSCNVFKRVAGVKYEPYTKKSGTSMSTPIVAGAAALVLQKFPGMTNEEVKQKMTLTATDMGEAWNKQGWGMIHVGRLLI